MLCRRVAAGVLGGLALATVRTSAGVESKPQTVILERAPGELGKGGRAGNLFVLTAAKGTEVLLFDSVSGELKPYLETGEASAKPTRLQGRHAALRVAVNDDRIAVACTSGVSLFKRETGELMEEAPYLYMPAAIAAIPDGSWAVSLMRLPFPEIEHADREKFGGPAPRFVVVNSKLEISR